ncbi:MAG TPA: hypothetical protein PLB52_03335 [Candidatus Moranbacteria bacterium]|nr:hypothetical protein [Candidatus Moranbacteria bacterium]
MLQKDIEKVLIFIAEKLNNAKINWLLIGSSNLALQGVPLEPNDVDISVGISDYNKIKNIFNKYKTLSGTTLKNKEAEEVTYLIKGVKVHFCFEYDHGFFNKFLKNNDKLKIKIGSVDIFCNSLVGEIEAYTHLDRKEKAESISKFLKTEIK